MKTESPRNPLGNFKWVYSILLPAVTVLALLVVSAFIPRPVFFHSKIADFFVRLWLCVWFCFGYIVMFDLDRYNSWLYGKRLTGPNPENDIPTRIWTLSMALMGVVLASIITRWILINFLSMPPALGTLLGVVNGLIFPLPLALQNKYFRF